MREPEASGWTEQNSRALMRAVRLAVVASGVALGIGLVMAAGVARAGDDEEDDRSIEDKIIGGLMAGIGGKTMENQGIDYRERSPLVVPPRLDLPPPVASSDAPKVANWPKDPDEARRKKAIAERKKSRPTVEETNRTLTPAELDAGRNTTAARNNDSVQPGDRSNNPVLSPSALGFDGNILNVFRGGKTEVKEFKGEPTRESLTQPPVGYQTPSPNYAYGLGAKENQKPAPVWNSIAGKYE